MNKDTSIPNENNLDLSISERRKSIFIMLILIIISGNPAMSFGFPHQPFYAAVGILFLFLVFRDKIKILAMFPLSIFLFFTFILFYQSYSFSFFPLITIFGFLVRLFIAYATVKLVKDFARTYVDVMYWLALLSFLFYIPQQVGNFIGFDFPEIFRPIELLFGEPERHIMPLFIHTFCMQSDNIYRNAGFFWEPGVLAGYLNLALVFLAAIRVQYNNKEYCKRLVIISLCLLSTFSTTSYIAFPFALLLHLRIQGTTVTARGSYLFFIICVIIPLTLTLYNIAWVQPFMKEKILNSIYVAENKSALWEADRIGTIIFDMDDIKERPFTGWGLHEETRYLLHTSLQGLSRTGRGNGMSDFAAKLGLPSLLLWMYLVFKYFFIRYKSDLIKAIVSLLCIMIILNGEIFLLYPLFQCFFFLLVPIRKVRFLKMSDADFVRNSRQSWLMGQDSQ